MRCPNCHDTHVRQQPSELWECSNCGYTWDEGFEGYDVLDYLDDLQCRYDLLVGR